MNLKVVFLFQSFLVITVYIYQFWIHCAVDNKSCMVFYFILFVVGKWRTRLNSMIWSVLCGPETCSERTWTSSRETGSSEPLRPGLREWNPFSGRGVKREYWTEQLINLTTGTVLSISNFWYPELSILPISTGTLSLPFYFLYPELSILPIIAGTWSLPLYQWLLVPGEGNSTNDYCCPVPSTCNCLWLDLN